jgi:hypothetical protein
MYVIGENSFFDSAGTDKHHDGAFFTGIAPIRGRMGTSKKELGTSKSRTARFSTSS